MSGALRMAEEDSVRLFDVLLRDDDPKAYSHLAPTDRAAIAEILRETKPAIRTVWESMH